MLRLLSNISPYALKRRNHTTTIILAWEKDSLVVVNVYTGKEWNKAIHNGFDFASCPGMVLSHESKLKDGGLSLSANDVIN